MIKKLLPAILLLSQFCLSNGQEIDTLKYTGTIQTFTIPANSYIRIDVYGAGGGTNSYSDPGKGAKMSGSFSGIIPGQVLKILVGGQGGSNGFSGGGGGGSFVVDSATNTPLIIAGGGGGSYWWGGGVDADTVRDGGASQGGNAGGTAGSGGPQSNSGGGGGGLNGDGSPGSCVNTNGGQSYINGAAGGIGDCFQGYVGVGGYGGGGGGTILSGDADGGAGGGGGYSGGGGGGDASAGNYIGGGGGGGSYNEGTDQINYAGIQSGDGLVIIKVYPIPNETDTLHYSGTLQTFTIPPNDYITIDVYGAEGGDNYYSPSGKGARMSGTFVGLPSGKVLSILIGGKGGNDIFSCGGGGGSFVVDSVTNDPLIVAGGGGGTFWWGGAFDADTSLDGTASQIGNPGGINGDGGTASNAGGGGGGFNGDGANSICANNGGQSFINGGAGGTGDCSGGSGITGGYGGGGGAGDSGGGGGGGYSGGGGGSDASAGNYVGGGGGGGSYNAGTDQINFAGVQTGDGLVIIKAYKQIITGNKSFTAAAFTSFREYPNPVSTVVNFDYELTSSASVTLDIYSAIGQKITVLNDKQSKGQHSVRWDVKNKIAAGIYSYRLQTGEAVKTGLLVVQ